MFKKRERPQAARKVEQAPEESEEGGGLLAGELAAKKSRRGAATASASSEGVGVSASTKKEALSEAGAHAARQQSDVFSNFKASGSTTNEPASDATRRLEVDTDVSHDHRAVLERNAQIDKGLKDGTLEKGVYRGMGAYKKYANQSEGAIAAAKFTGLLGPLRSSMSNVRSTIRVEYAFSSQGLDGGFCKDYKETGYCGFGDSCKFAHDRGDYKSGFQLEQEWEEKQKQIEAKKKKKWEKRMQKRAKAEAEGKQVESDDSDSSSLSDSDEDLPKECPECNETWESCATGPIQTTCGHYFCEDCAMTGFAKSPKCLNCGANTNGIFNAAETLLEKLQAIKDARAERKRMRAVNRTMAQKRDTRDPFGVSLE
eukprot:TRINITY_DN108866_c0_g1_i1.p1 TRINITY_DN108866_c0_g1~~TRINITY_DN108866_c0_g1_i1.p1  ORF type:complete len:370 (-),score=89.01 TRINITY_DN108866_c0_g1_i1:115-1224(-)